MKEIFGVGIDDLRTVMEITNFLPQFLLIPPRKTMDLWEKFSDCYSASCLMVNEDSAGRFWAFVCDEEDWMNTEKQFPDLRTSATPEWSIPGSP